MGFRFPIKEINSTAKIIEGDIRGFIEDSLESDESLRSCLDYLKKTLESFDDNFFFGTQYYTNMKNLIKTYIKELEGLNLENSVKLFRDNDNSIDAVWKNENIVSFRMFLDKIHGLLGKAKIKAILLPGFENNEINQLLRSKDIIKNLIGIHPGNSCLILQVKEEVPKDSVFLYNSFKNFGIALKNIDEWPGVLLWDNNNSVFIKVREKEEIITIFEMICDKYTTLDDIHKHFYYNKNDKLAYFIHLSDLHLGDEDCNLTQHRLLTIIDKQISELEKDADIYAIITGDLKQEPKKEYDKLVKEFMKKLNDKMKKKPIFVLGNHDLHPKGLSMPGYSRGLNYSITIIEEIKVIIIQFDSNEDGVLAQGTISSEQLMEIGNVLDNKKNINEYTLIGILHHHPLEIEKPEWYEENWIEKILGKENFEKTMKLNGSELFLDWIKQRKIKIILHGHKHIPQIILHEKSFIIACGSSTGQVKHKVKGKTYLSYNVIKYNVTMKSPVSCVLYFEDNLGAGVQHLQTKCLI